MKVWNVRARLVVLICAAGLFLGLEMYAYYLIKLNVEGQSVELVDCLYWIIVTLSTLGSYPSGVALTSAEGKLLTIATVFTGLFLLFIFFPFVLAPWFEKKMQKALAPKKRPIPAKGHVIVCGFTEVGKEVVQELIVHEIPCVLIEMDDDLEERIRKLSIPYIIADPTETRTLNDANIRRAIAIVVCAGDDTNAFICLTAKKIRPKIRIIANLDEEGYKNVLMRAGAEKVVSSKSMAGLLLAKRALGQHDLDVVDRSGSLGKMEIRQYTIMKGSWLISQTLRGSQLAQKTGTNVLGIWREGQLYINPPPNHVFKERDILVFMGTEVQFKSLNDKIAGVTG